MISCSHWGLFERATPQTKPIFGKRDVKFEAPISVGEKFSISASLAAELPKEWWSSTGDVGC
jgi:hypothetical protein